MALAHDLMSFCHKWSLLWELWTMYCYCISLHRQWYLSSVFISQLISSCLQATTR